LVIRLVVRLSRMFSELYVFEPPNPVNKFYYKCDKKFHLEDLLDLYVVYDTYAVLLISGKRTDLYTYSKNNTNLIKSLKLDLPNQHKTGGSSAPRFGRIRDEKINLYMKIICEILCNNLLKDGVFSHLGLIIAGPAQLKDQIQLENLFKIHFEKHLIATFTIPEINDQSINCVIELVEKKIFGTVDDQITKRFESMLSNPQMIDLFVFGTENVLEQFKSGLLSEIFIQKDYLDLLEPNSKTIITYIDEFFAKKYGITVGIRYYAEPDIVEI
jgi:peptide subunit release factor 1 (eRF1)